MPGSGIEPLSQVFQTHTLTVELPLTEQQKPHLAELVDALDLKSNPQTGVIGSSPIVRK